MLTKSILITHRNSVSQCNQLSRKGMCTTYVDPSNTVVFPSSATVGDYCDSVSVNPCSGATDPTTCIGITAFNGTRADVDNPVPMCMWNVHTSSCIPMDPLEIGTQDVTPTSATSTVALNYDVRKKITFLFQTIVCLHRFPLS